MTAPTYIAVTPRRSQTVHLSADGKYTLCGWAIRDDWRRHDERVTLFATWLAGVNLCQVCERVANRARLEAQEEPAP